MVNTEEFYSELRPNGSQRRYHLWPALEQRIDHVMLCYVHNVDDGHIHFVDRSEGGYTQAAKMLKRKLAVPPHPGE
jgi:Protein of unknown function (DUF3095)